MFFHNRARYSAIRHTFIETCTCGAVVELDAEYVEEYPMASTEYAQTLMAERCTCEYDINHNRTTLRNS